MTDIARAGADAAGGARPRRTSWPSLGSLALALASTVAALVVVEAGMRAISFTARLSRETIGAFRWTVYDPVLIYRNVPGYENPALGVRINSLGFRGPELRQPKPPGTIRIASLGDSTTFGIWMQGPARMRADADYPAGLARRARAAGYDRVEVVNAGVLGHSSSEGLVELLAQVLPLDVDVLTIRFGNNDHGIEMARRPAPLATKAEWVLLHRAPAWAWHSELVRLAFHGYRSATAWRKRGRPQRVPVDEFEGNLRRFVDVGRERGIRVVFLDFPYREIERGASPGQPFPVMLQAARSLEELHGVHAEYQAVVARVARETGTPFVTTLGALRRRGKAAFSDYDLSHPTHAGSRVIARELFVQLRRLGWLGPATGR